MFMLLFVGISVIGCWLLNKFKAWLPNMSQLGHIAIIFLLVGVFDFLMESLFTHTQIFAYVAVYSPLSFWAGTPDQFPIYESTGIAAVTVPYGIDVSPTDGTVWYSRLFGDKIGRIDPKTLEVKEYDSPVRGPRRMRFDRHGSLWLTGFSDGILARLDPKAFSDASGFSADGAAAAGPSFRATLPALGPVGR